MEQGCLFTETTHTQSLEVPLLSEPTALLRQSRIGLVGLGPREDLGGNKDSSYVAQVYIEICRRILKESSNSSQE